MEGGEGLAENDELRLGHEPAAELDELLLAARQLSDVVIGVRREAQDRQHLSAPSARRRGREACRSAGDLEVLQRGQAADDVYLLVHSHKSGAGIMVGSLSSD